MAEHPDHTPATGALSATDKVLAVIAAEEPYGATAAYVARIIGLGLDGGADQDTLAELVQRGVLTQRGLGAGVIYTLAAGL